MRCPSCGGGQLKTHDTRQRHDEEGDFFYTVRIRRCLECQHRFRTIEVDVERFNQIFAEEEQPLNEEKEE